VRRRRLATLASVVGVLSITMVLFTGGLSLAGPAPRLSGVTVTGPIRPGSLDFNGTLYGSSFPLSRIGYERSQFFLSGTAHSFIPVHPLTSDGKWSVTTGSGAQYRTRVTVYRPIDPRKFNGTVVVEWLNVTGGVDDSPDWTLAHNELVREGFAWVGVSAQATGVNAAKSADPRDYSSLSHPGDSFSYDIFSQAGKAVRRDAAVMLGGLRPRTLLAVGQSQSAFRLVTYIDAVQPIAHVYDGFLLHSRFADGAPLSQSPQQPVSGPTTTLLRSDLHVPVFVFETATDVYVSNAADRLHDYPSGPYRLWEVAGSSHYDEYGLDFGPTDTGDGRGAVENLAAMQNPTDNPQPGLLPNCVSPINTGGTHWVLNAAIHWLNRWVVDGTPPPRAPVLATTQLSPVVFQRDGNGNLRGGVRSPQVDAPVAALSGVGNSPAFCGLFGTTVPFTASQLARLYENHRQFVSRWDQATERDVKAGYLLPADAVELKRSAASSQVGK
jgi:Alpha/beta hydrolase domain